MKLKNQNVDNVSLFSLIEDGLRSIDTYVDNLVSMSQFEELREEEFAIVERMENFESDQLEFNSNLEDIKEMKDKLVEHCIEHERNFDINR